MNKKTFSMSCVLLLYLVASIIYVHAQTPQYYNYNNVGTSNNNFPFNVTTGKEVQWLVGPGELNMPGPAPSGNITKIYLFTINAGTATFTNLTIKLGQGTTITTLPTGVFYTGQLDTVYYRASGSLTGSATSWMVITLDTPFPYDPTQSLIIDVGQCGHSGTGPTVRQNSITGSLRRNYSVGGCPFVYSGQDANVVNFGVDIAPASCNLVWSLQTSGITTSFSTVRAVNALVGWAGGASGVVRKTTDGGATWVAASTTGQLNGTVYCMDALDANTCWASTSPATGTLIYKTTNGGTNWTQVYSQTGGFLDGLQMINATTGYALGDPVASVWTLVQTTNGGDNWTQMPSAPAQVGTEAGWNNSFQIVGTNMWFGTSNTKVYQSTNLGLNWTGVTTTGQLNSYALHFNSSSLGVNAGTLVQKSTDGGATWANTAGTVPGTGNMLGAEGYGTDFFWIARGAGIYVTTNGGTSWAAVTGVTPTGTVNAIDFAIVGGCPTGWAAGSDGKIYAMKIVTGISEPGNNLPNDYALSQNYPNPFNPSTVISFAMPKAANVKITVFDMLGREVATILNDFRTAGNHSITFNGENLASGVYFYTINAGDFTATKKMMLIK